MSEQTKPRFRVALRQELSQWREQGIFTPETAEALLSRYPILPAESRLVAILSTTGAVLIGLGALLFVGANWETMSRLAKLALIVGAIAATHIAAWFCKWEPGEHPKLGSALLLLGSLLFGAGIALVSQIFNFDTKFSDGMLIWMLGSGAMALLTRSRSLAVLIAALAPTWTTSLSNDVFTAAQLPHAGIIPLALSSLAAGLISFRAQSRVGLYVLLAGVSAWFICLSGLTWVGWIGYGTLLFLLYLILHKKNELMASPFLYIGAASALCGGFVSTFDKSSGFSLDPCNSIALFTVTALSAWVAYEHRKEQRAEVVGATGLAIWSVIICCVAAGTARPFLGNALLLGIIASLIATGMRLQKGALINLSIGFILIDIFARYFDLFFSMLDRSLFFMVGGVILLAVGTIAEKNRRRMVQAFI